MRLSPPPWAGIVLPSPDQERYGPETIPATVRPHERDGLLLFMWEGGGVSVSCSCEWFRWHPTEAQVRAWAKEHTHERKKGEDVTYDCPALRKSHKTDEHRQPERSSR